MSERDAPSQAAETREARAIVALRTPDAALARVPNTIRQSIADIIEHQQDEHDRLTEEVARLRDALGMIADHWACNYDHQYANTEQYRGPYGIGIVDGHRAAALIARAALPKETT